MRTLPALTVVTAVTARSKEEVPDYQMIFAPPSGHCGAGGYSRGSGELPFLKKELGFQERSLGAG